MVAELVTAAACGAAATALTTYADAPVVGQAWTIKSWDERNLKSVQTLESKDSQEATQNDKSHGIVNYYGIDINERSLKSEQTQSMALQNSKEAIPNQDDKSGLFS